MPIWRIVVFLSVILGLSFLIHWRIGARVATLLEFGPAASWALRGVLAVLLLSIPTSFLLSRSNATGMAVKAGLWVGYSWMGIAFLLLVGTLLGDLASLLAWSVEKASGQDLTGARRIGDIAGMATGSLLALLALVGGRAKPVVHEVVVDIPGLPEEFDGYRIAHLSDTHVSHLLDRAWASDVARRVDSAQADLVVHTGDLVDGSVEAMSSSVEPIAGLRGRDGSIFVRGNHESYSGATAWTSYLRGMGWTVLVNEHVEIRRGDAKMVVVGLPDAHEGHLPGTVAPDPVRAFSGIPAGIPILLLAHQPVQALGIQGRGVSLQLSGHTHGGQIWPFGYLVHLQQPMSRGLATIGNVKVFTSLGTGSWGPPLRLFAPSEVPIVKLRRVPKVV